MAKVSVESHGRFGLMTVGSVSRAVCVEVVLLKSDWILLAMT